ncbi:asparagine synthase (glutamine-hydrolyzing) [Occallatibacter riparius]|uniref:asparagine synthase (glutamine-hydrolyzing) n=1 Tax=Occallatibacter riparius TaxID=1002689 RepID=A0A9J7BGK7_9BACT|nr:asparagine synthase (glutamine-hydrolyzing) [Occallatibacter riparius]UWZ81920.1 asparagine synthase (glutamine-hydrolyzing) [Occallatibacter riparius]
MCGIAGVLSLNDRVIDRAEPARMISLLRHRGPDAFGMYVRKQVALAHARLSIIDLDGGAQPMGATDHSAWLTFNGEIYNYVELREELASKGHWFRTESDTEVILAAYQEWNEDCVNHFNGQWAFALWDCGREKLFLSRDRMGVRPLYYARTADSFLFASEMKAILASREVSAEVDLQALDQTFTFWSPLAPRTAFRDIRQVPPASSMVVQKGEIRTWRYWRPSFEWEEAADAAAEKRLSDELFSLLYDATRIRLRSDVSVGAYLSGGIDSTVTTALAKSIVKDRLRSFSITFDDPEFDESRFQNEASAFLCTNHTSSCCTPVDIARVFPEVVWHTEQPILRTAAAPMFLLSKLVHDSGFKVVLTGEGSDEVLGGYDIFKEAKIRQFWGKQPDSRWRFLLLKRLYPYMHNLRRQPASYLKSFFRVTPTDLQNPFFSHLPRWDLTAKIKGLFSAAVKDALGGAPATAELQDALPRGFAGWDCFARAQYLELEQLLPGYILSSQGDRMAMAHSVECRYPFLDYRVVEFANRLSPKLKMKALDEKHLLKKALRGWIPQSIIGRHKQPYRAPDGKCFFSPDAPEYVQELLSPSALNQHGIFDPRSVSLLINKFITGRAIGTKDNMALIAVLSTQLLLQQSVHQSLEMTSYAAHTN